MRIRTAAVFLLLGSLVFLSGCFSTGPLAEFSITPSPAYGRPPLTRTFDASPSRSPRGAISSYAWDFRDGETGSGETVSHTFTEKGVYAVALTVTDTTGAAGTITHSVEVLGVPPVAYFDYSPQGATTQIPVVFDASLSSDSDGSIVEWIWSFGDETTGDGVVVEHLFPKGGTRSYDVTLTVIDDDGGRTSTTRKVTIYGCDCG